MFNENDLFKEKIYITELKSEDELIELEKRLKPVRVTHLCSGRSKGCTLAINVDGTFGRAHWCSKDGFQKHFYILKFNTDGDLVRATCGGKCGHLKLHKSKPKPTPDERVEILRRWKKSIEEIISIMVLIGPTKYDDLVSILNQQKDGANSEVFNTFFEMVTKHQYLEVFKLLGNKGFQTFLLQERRSYHGKRARKLTKGARKEAIRDRVLEMIPAILECLEYAYESGWIEEEHYELCVMTAAATQVGVESEGIKQSTFLQDTTEAKVAAFLHPYGYAFREGYIDSLLYDKDGKFRGATG